MARAWCATLRKSLYGLRQAPNVWYNNMSKALAQIGFEKVSSDPSLWVCNKGDLQGIVYLTSIVDDLAIGGPSKTTTLKTVKSILDKYPGKHNGRIYHFAGMKLTWDDPNHFVYITQAAHIDEMLDKFSGFMPNSNPLSLPMKAGIKLCRAGSDLKPNSGALDVSIYPYMSLIGSINYLFTMCRPDITYVVNQLSKYANAPTVEHWALAIDVLRYL